MEGEENKMTLEQKQKIVSKAIKKSENGKHTYVLIKGNEGAIIQSGSLAYRYVRDYGFMLYAKCKDGILTL